MRIFLLISFLTLLSSCTTVELAKEVSKVSKSVKTSMDNVLKNENDENKLKSENEDVEIVKTIDEEIDKLEKEKDEKDKKLKQQKKKSQINFIGKNSKEIEFMIGKPALVRNDGNSITMRFDNSFCQLFLFSNIAKKNIKIMYFEIRNKKGVLIINKEKITECYKNFELV